MRRTLTRIIIALLAAAAARSANAQVVRGDVADAATHEPLVGAMVMAYDTVGARVGGAITDDSGRFALRLPAPGRYRLRAERIGYASSAMVTFDIAAGAARAEHLVASSVAIVLPWISVTAEPRCVVRATGGAETAALWEEARKALYATQLALEGQLVYAIRRRYVRTLDGTSLIVRREFSRVDSVTLEHPWATEATPEQLARDGYGVVHHGDPVVVVPGIVVSEGDSSLAAPDADVLLSDAFARTHCFTIRSEPEQHAGLIGLAFEPARKRSVPEVSGVLWLDSATARLRFMEFRHTNLYPEVSPLRYGGRMDFEQLPGGLWIVRRWYIRLPVVSSAAMNAAGMGDARYRAGGRHVAVYHEDGGEVLSATVVSARPPSP